VGHYGKFYRTELNALLRLLDVEGIEVAAVEQSKAWPDTWSSIHRPAAPRACSP
jgi:hypothetical protein